MTTFNFISTFAVILVAFEGLFLRSSAQSDVRYFKETCKPGHCQSPIDISIGDVIFDRDRLVIKTPLSLQNYGSLQVTVQNNGLQVGFTPRPNSTPLPTLSGGSTRHKYVFDSVHFHHNAEHTVNSKLPKYEFHMVHHKANMTLAAAKKQRNGVVVFGIFCDVKGSSADSPVAQLVPGVKKALKPGKVSNAGTIDVGKLLPSDTFRFYTYLGSLTTPAFEEAVIWIVYKRHITMSTAQDKILSSVLYKNGKKFNNRKLQPSNNRMIYTPTMGDD